MAFNLVRLSQQDPKWKNEKLGSSNLTLGSSGCALTSVAMLLSGFGYPETPSSLNQKMKNRGGFMGAAIVWGAVSSIYPKMRYQNLVICRDTDAPIDAIGNSIAAGQPVLLEVDSSPSSGLQTHWVVAYKKVGKDFYILDPWPYPTEEGKDILLMSRYSQGRELKRAISAVVWYECQAAGTGSPAPTPAPSTGSGFSVRVVQGIPAGLRLRSAPTTVSDTLGLEASGTELLVVEAESTARPKVGVYDQWLRVRDPQGVEGYVAAWYVEHVSGAASAPAPVAPAPAVELPSTQSLMDAVNLLRASKGLPVYQSSPTLNKIAQDHANWMASSGRVEHVNADGKRPFQRALDAGYALAGDLSKGGFCSENIYAGMNVTVADAMTMWQGDDAHLNTMLSTNLKEIGAGVAVAGSTIFFCIDAAQPKAGAPVPQPEPQPAPPAEIPLTPLGQEVASVAMEPVHKINLPASATYNQRLVGGIWNRYGGLLNALSKSLGIEIGAAVAVLAVESGGQGFGPDGRMIIRFENHVFYNLWGKNNQVKFNQHFIFNSGQTWTGHKWRPTPNESWRPVSGADFHGVQSNEWDVLNFASKLDDTAAKKSISMGSPQIMGFNHATIGYPTVQDMFNAFSSSDRYQIVGLFDFVKNSNSRAIPALRTHDFTTFASTYNGTGQAQTYGNLIRTNFDVFNNLYKGIPEEPTAPAPAPAPQPAPSPEPVTPAPQPEPQPVPPTPVTPTPPSQPEPEPAPKPEDIFVYVSSEVGSNGLVIRKTPDSSGKMVGSAKVGQNLMVLDDADTRKKRLGVYGKWLNVRASGGVEGYVAAWYVKSAPDVVAEPEPAPATPTPVAPPSAPAEPVTPVPQPEPEPEPAPAPQPEKEKLYVLVLKSVGSSGLRMRAEASQLGRLIAIQPAGARLRVLDDPDVARTKIGQNGSWLWIEDRLGRAGYVAAWYVALEKAPAPESTNVSFDIDFSETAPVELMTVHVNSLAGAGGLRLRTSPVNIATVTKTLAVNTPLEVLDDPSTAEGRIGVFNEWLHVRDPLGAEGYVAAWFVEK